jgi:transcriptional regulator with XRE-family HTH domain
MSIILGKKLRNLREHSGMSTRMLGEKIGKTHSQVTKYEMGTHEPTLKILLKYKEIFNVSLDYLCDDNKE